MTLEERLKTAIRSGGLLSIALYKSSIDKDTWVATYLNDSGSTRQCVAGKDPIETLEKAITPLRQKGADVVPAKVQREQRRRDSII